jgi:DNA invertase Pin-like site-specific DNA recombinase
MISKRTKDALAAAKRRGVKLGGDRGVRPTARARKLAIEVSRQRATARAADSRQSLRSYRRAAQRV